MFNETEILDSRETVDDLGVEIGTIGWEGDPDPHYDIDQSDEDGVTLVKVQLFRGRVPGTTPKKGTAQGHKILARLSSQHGGLWSVPRLGVQCIVNFPGGFQLTPGSAVITAVAGAYRNDQFRPDREIWDAGEDRDVLIKGRRVVLQDYENRFLSVGPEGIQAVDELGNGYHIHEGTVTIFAASGDPPDAKSVVTLSASQIALLQKDNGGAFLTIANGAVSCQGKNFTAATGNCRLGAGSSGLGVPLPVLVGAPPGTPSTCVFAAPG